MRRCHASTAIPQGYADAAAKCHAMGEHYQEGGSGCQDTGLGLQWREQAVSMRKGLYSEVELRVHRKIVREV